jgi:hypothetical protein
MALNYEVSFEEMQSILQGILLSQQQFQIEMVETKTAADRAIAFADRAAQIAEFNGCAIQSMLEQSATDRLRDEERAQRHEEEMRELKATNCGLVNLTVLIDEDRPTILCPEALDNFWSCIQRFQNDGL